MRKSWPGGASRRSPSGPRTFYGEIAQPKEADHDALLYRLHQKAASEIEPKGGKVVRVQLDSELKEKLYRKLA